VVLVALLIFPVTAGEGPELSTAPPLPKAGGTTKPNAIFSAEVQQIDFANGLLGRKLFEEAVVEFDAFLEAYPKSARATEATFQRAEALFALTRYKESRQGFSSYLKLAPQGSLRDKALLRIGCGHFERKEDAKAIEALRKIASLKGDAKVAQAGAYYLGRALQRSGKVKEARIALRSALSGGGEMKALALFSLGQMGGDAGNLVEGEAAYRVFCSEFPRHRLAPEAGLRRAHLLRLNGKAGDAAKEYARLLALNLKGDLAARAHLGQGWIHFNRGQYPAAEAACGRGLQVTSLRLAPDLHYLLGLILLRQKKYEPAVTELTRVTDGAYQRLALLQRSWAHLGAGQLAPCAAQAQAFLKGGEVPETGTAYYLLGTVAFRKAEYTSAAAHYRQVLKRKASEYREESAFQLAIALQRLEMDVEAAKAYASFIAAFPKSAHRSMALLQQAGLYKRMKKLPEAIKGYTAVRAVKGAAPSLREQAWLEQALCHYQLKQFKEMDVCYRAILKDFSVSAAAPEALYWVAWNAQRERRWKEATQLYQQFLKKHGKLKLADRVRYRLGMTWFQAGDERKAADAFFGILTQHPQIAISQQELLWLGRRFTRDHQLARASVVYDVLLKRHPGPEIQSMALYYQAEVLRQQKKHEEAVNHYSKLVAGGDPRFLSLARLGQGMSLRQLKKLPEARSALDAVRFAPDDPMLATLQLELGLIDRAEGKLPEAIRRFMRVGLLYDDVELAGQALFEAGSAYEAKKNREKALSCYRELTDPRPGSYGEKHGAKSPWSAKARARIKALQKDLPAAAGS
jgi:TolA-binding protein